MNQWKQWEFNQLMQGYYKEFGPRKCQHSPNLILFYRLCAVLTLGVVTGFIINHI